MSNCFACGKKLGANPALVDTGEDQTVYVGQECFKKIKSAGKAGLAVRGFGGRLRLLTPERKAYMESKGIGGATDSRRARLHRTLDAVMDAKTAAYESRTPEGKVVVTSKKTKDLQPTEYKLSKPPTAKPHLSVLNPKDLEKMTGVAGAKLKDGEPVPISDAAKYEVVSACYGDVDNRYDVQLKVGEKLEWLGGESSGSLFKRSNGTEVFIKRSDADRCIKMIGRAKDKENKSLAPLPVFIPRSKRPGEDDNPFDRDTDAGAARIVKREAAAGLTAEAIVKKYGFSLSFVKEEMPKAKAKDELLPVSVS